jgi:glycine/D-amino acid oxidase-like deaminating enzyme
MNTTADFLIVGGGLYGCSTAYYLALHGAQNVVVLEKGDLCSGGTAKSCAIVRTHYSIEANIRHAAESLRVFANFDEMVGGDIGWRQVGYLIAGPAEHREPMETVFRQQNEMGIDARSISAAEARAFHPLLQFEDVAVIGFDTLAGFADPYLTTTAYAQRAREMGVEIHTGTGVTNMHLNGRLKRVETNKGTFESPVVLLAVGPWINQIGQMIGLHFPVEVSRHKVITLKIDRPYEMGWPIVKDLTTEDKMYFRPDTGGVVLVGTGDHGDPLENPDTLNDFIDDAHIERMAALVSNRMPAFADGYYVAGWTGAYDITPDWNPIVGPVPGIEGLFVATGFSGHGFKMAPTVGEGLAQTILGQKPRMSIAMYDLSRFDRGQALHGVYGIGSIS